MKPIYFKRREYSNVLLSFSDLDNFVQILIGRTLWPKAANGNHFKGKNIILQSFVQSSFLALYK